MEQRAIPFPQPMHGLLACVLRKAAGVLAASGALANVVVVMLGLALGAVAVTPARAASPGTATQCTTNTSMGSATISYTSGTLGTATSAASSGGQVTCAIVTTTSTGFPNLCLKATYLNVTNGANTIPINSVKWTASNYTYGSLLQTNPSAVPLTSGTDASYISSISSITSQGINAVISGQALSFGIAGSATSSSTPSGTYTASIPFSIIMGPPAGYSASQVCAYMDATPTYQASDTVTLNVVIPQVCSISTTTAVNFGSVTVSSITAGAATAAGAVATTCNSATPYTIYLGDGGYRQAVGSGLRQMSQGSNRLPYQLYKDSAYTQVWDATGGTSAIGGAGGVTITGTGTITTPIYGLIPANIALPKPGSYTDTVVVTLAY